MLAINSASATKREGVVRVMPRASRAIAAGVVLTSLSIHGRTAEAADLVLKRVVLSTGGGGYLESEATVEGDASLTLDVPLDQVDDVLKSLIVFDSNGSAGEITLPGRE